MENLSTFKVQELYSVPAGVKFTIFQYGSLILVCAYTYNIEILKYGIQYKCTLPYDCYNTATAITGNNGSSGQFSLVNNILTVNSTDNQVPLKNTFMGELENLYITKEEKTKLSLTQINNVNLNNITEAGFYTSSGWSNNIVGLPSELNNNEGRAFYLVVFSLENGDYCQQILYSFKGIIFYRAITGANSTFTQWRRI